MFRNTVIAVFAGLIAGICISDQMRAVPSHNPSPVDIVQLREEVRREMAKEAAAVAGTKTAASFAERRPGIETAEYKTHVEELVTHVEQRYKETCRAMLLGERQTFGQGFQDWLIMQNFGYNYRGWGEGFYIDIGTNDATVISNTLALEKCLGWRGICVEPQERFHDRIRKERSCTLYPHCVLGKAQTVKFRGQNGLLSVVGLGGDSSVEGTMTCKGVKDMVEEVGVDVDMIDLVSIDIEGAEGSVLKCWPHQDVKVRHWLVETNKQCQRAVDWYFQAHDYAGVMMFMDWQNRNGYFLDTLYERRERKHVRPPTGPGDMVLVNGLGEVFKQEGTTKFGLWPFNRSVVARSAQGEAPSAEWLECTEE